MSKSSYRMYFLLKLNRPLNENEMISPGGYEIHTKSGKNYRFDFLETEGISNKNDRREIELCCKNPDYSYENTSEIAPDLIRDIDSFEDFYLDLEGCTEDLEVLSIEGIRFQFFEADKVIYEGVSNSIINKYFNRDVELEEELER